MFFSYFNLDLCRSKNLKTQVLGCPKTIDGDLKSKEVPTSFGFDTACKVNGDTHLSLHCARVTFYRSSPYLNISNVQFYLLITPVVCKGIDVRAHFSFSSVVVYQYSFERTRCKLQYRFHEIFCSPPSSSISNIVYFFNLKRNIALSWLFLPLQYVVYKLLQCHYDINNLFNIFSQKYS